MVQLVTTTEDDQDLALTEAEQAEFDTLVELYLYVADVKEQVRAQPAPAPSFMTLLSDDKPHSIDSLPSCTVFSLKKEKTDQPSLKELYFDDLYMREILQRCGQKTIRRGIKEFVDLEDFKEMLFEDQIRYAMQQNTHYICINMCDVPEDQIQAFRDATNKIVAPAMAKNGKLTFIGDSPKR